MCACVYMIMLIKECIRIYVKNKTNFSISFAGLYIANIYLLVSKKKNQNKIKFLHISWSEISITKKNDKVKRNINDRVGVAERWRVLGWPLRCVCVYACSRINLLCICIFNIYKHSFRVGNMGKGLHSLRTHKLIHTHTLETLKTIARRSV